MSSKFIGNLIVFTGPSGVGKGTVVKELGDIQELRFSISVTTRSCRPGEEDGVNYFYKSHEEFDQLIVDDKLLEWAEFVGNKYGTPRDFVENCLRNGQDVFLEIEVQGALQVKEKFPEAIMVFLLPPSYEALEERLIKRATETEDIIAKRLKKAKEEMLQIDIFDHHVINDDAIRAAKEVKSIILNSRSPREVV